ncbi:MAG TPA: 1-deoxy-D-xylulose-5-phosphate synthase [Acidimicrobiales bacterium]|nr:1-deoxy-D-xylulose-5-phosphate synthase [Acidimicrobiales bacterium]
MTTLRDTELRTEAARAPTWGDGVTANGHGANGHGANGHGTLDDIPVPPALRTLSPARLRAMDRPALDRLAAEIREFLVACVSETGGHLGSNLGAVELSIALHRVFSSPTDPIVWDTGHQSYVHKLVTGRAEGFGKLRRAGGLSGYPNRAESVHDLVENSHASTALSYAEGLARARDARGDHHHVVAVVGDGALTGGVAYEALNNIGVTQRRVIVVLNDNGRSYAPTISPITTARRSMQADGSASGPSAFFGALGFSYLGPVDGHDIDAVEAALDAARGSSGPVVVHAHTVKGRDYAPAELDGEKCLHDVSPFHVATGEPRVPKGSVPSYTDAFGQAILDEAAARPELVAVTAAMTGPTGLLPFAERYGDRLIDVGIAEQHAVTLAAGMAMGGLRPVVAVYSTFLNRAWDQVVHDVGLHHLPVVFCLDRAGVTGDDGPSHHGIFDLALLTKVPGMTVLAPSSYEEVAVMLHEALEHLDGPVAIRWPKTPARRCAETGTGLRARRVSTGDGSVCLLGVGKLLAACELAADELAADGVAATVWDVRVAHPLDPEMLADASSHALVVTAEDGIADGGVGASVAAALRDASICGPSSDTTVVTCGLPTAYLRHGKPDDLLAAQGLDGRGITRSTRRALRATPARTR